MDTLDDYSDEAEDALEHADDLLDVLDSAAEKTGGILEQVDALHALLDSYIPDVQETIADSRNIITTTSTSLRDLRSFLGSLESLMKNTGPNLDAGTQQTLSGLADALRRSTVGLDQTDNIRDAADVITDLIEEKWDSFTGEDNNLLLMDAGAPPVSMTSVKNGTPESIQYIMRTQEITADDSAPQTEETAQPQESSTFFGRVAQIFIDFWNFITGLFK
jgi:putative membrane protein